MLRVRKRINLLGVVWCLLVLANGPVRHNACYCPGAEELNFFECLLGICCVQGHHHNGDPDHNHHSDPSENWVAETAEECRHFEFDAPDPCLRSVQAAAQLGPQVAVIPETTPLSICVSTSEPKRPLSTLQVKPPDLHTRTIVLRI